MSAPVISRSKLSANLAAILGAGYPQLAIGAQLGVLNAHLAKLTIPDRLLLLERAVALSDEAIGSLVENAAQTRAAELAAARPVERARAVVAAPAPAAPPAAAAPLSLDALVALDPERIEVQLAKTRAEISRTADPSEKGRLAKRAAKLRALL